MTRALAVLAVATLGLSGCQATLTQDTETRVMPIEEAVAVEGPAPQGRFFVTAGPTSLRADLWELSFGPRGRYERLTDHGRVTTVAGCPESVVVAAAQEEVGFVDTLQRVEGKRFTTIPAPQGGTGSNPDLSDDCTILYSQPDASGGTQLRRYDPDTGLADTVASGPNVAGGDWGPAGEVVVLERRPSGPVLVMIRPDGTTAEIEAGVPDIGGGLWGKGGWIASEVFSGSDPSTATLFINPATGARSTLEGWLPLAWSPAGDELLLRDAAKGTTLAITGTADLTSTRNVGVSEAGPIWDAVWLPAR